MAGSAVPLTWPAHDPDTTPRSGSRRLRGACRGQLFRCLLAFFSVSSMTQGTAFILSHARGASRSGATALRAGAEVGAQDVVRVFVLRNKTAAHGIAEWGHVPPSSSQVSQTPAGGGRVRAFQSFGMGAKVASCTIGEVPYAEGGLGSKVWESSLALSCWGLMNQASVIGKNVLELGSGCGLGGIMLGAAGAAKVTLTDFHGEHEQFVVKADGTLESARLRAGTGIYSVDRGVYADEAGSVSFPPLRNLHENLQRNKGGGREGKEGEGGERGEGGGGGGGGGSGELAMATLDWSSARRELGTFDLVVGSDCIYAGAGCVVSGRGVRV